MGCPYVAVQLRKADEVLQEAWKLVDGMWHRDVKPQQLGILKSKISKLAIDVRRLTEYCEKKDI